MNWDWDKLQEKRQRRGNKPVPHEDDPQPFLPEGPRFGRFVPNTGGGLLFGLVFLGLTVLWLASGFFIVNPGEEGVILVFGKLERTVKAGPHYHLPYPIATHLVVNTEQVRTLTVGRAAEAAQAGEEPSNMFTGDENIIHIQFRVQYEIKDIERYLFGMRSPDEVVSAAAEAAMREVVGAANIEAIFTEQRGDLQQKAKDALQAIMDEYGNGIRIRDVQLLDVAAPTEVRDAFAAYAGAREEMAKIRSDAMAYRNSIVPVAVGTAQSLINDAMAYRIRRLQSAKGEAERFTALDEQYRKNPAIIRTRMYLEAMDEIFSSPGLEKTIISKDVKGSLLPLLQLGNTPAPTTAPAKPADARGGPR